MHTGTTLDAVIVGAGIAGLHTARLLHRAGRSVVVVEARSRVGGRLWSTIHDGLDLGATWFWPGEQRTIKATQDLGIGVHDQYLSGDALFHDGTSVQRIEGNPIDVASYRWSGGAQQLAIRTAEQLPTEMVVLAQPVTAVARDGDQLVVSTSERQWRGDHVVLAVPPALAVAHLSFDPGLPDQIRALAAATPVWMGAMTKIAVHYEQPFWRLAGLAGAVFSHRGPMREIHDMSGPDGSPAALFGFCPQAPPGGPSQAEIVAQLTELFGPDAADPVAVHIQDWRSEPWTSPAGVDDLDNFQTYGHRSYGEATWDGRLHWASTETGTTSPGHVEGALSAAERTFEAILARPTARSQIEERHHD